MVSVNGRNGDYIIDNGRYKNVMIPYRCFINHNFVRLFDELKSFLLSRKGYVKIEDSYNPEYYRMGVFTASIEPELATANTAGTFSLTFNCKPQKYLKTGQTWYEIPKQPSKLELANPTFFDAIPDIRMDGLNGFERDNTVAMTRYGQEYTKHFDINIGLIPSEYPFMDDEHILYGNSESLETDGDFWIGGQYGRYNLSSIVETFNLVLHANATTDVWTPHDPADGSIWIRPNWFTI